MTVCVKNSARDANFETDVNYVKKSAIDANFETDVNYEMDVTFETDAMS